MEINSVDISTFNAKQVKVEIGYSEFTNDSTWVKGSLMPVLVDNNTGFKTIGVELLVKASNKNSINLSISNILSNLIKPATLKLDGFINKYSCILQEHSVEKIKAKTHYKLTLKFIGYEYGAEVTETMNRIGIKVITVDGNTKTPAIIEITPTVDIIDLDLYGFGSNDIIIKNLKANKKVIINGETGLVTEDGINKFEDYESWEFPFLSPGTNIIASTRTTCDITIKYKPRFI